ncbi:DUF2065 domain-containing protein [Ruegeria pomeroyi]|uniref:DUF2065 domain-containing protein n=2 Tax=Ruegeria pomeroyi TaxID=89184 RepID=Q5LTT0_RUEPO|nr:DUF2065 domain-containing protein [Ruegeria pomeroyi]HCE71609.1 DUF2065 domain-containing protein [Ruegeria sp.]AAV94621.1 hypothetical protein SPO1332 [Ruegeria pomeroyi DSS-3]NVK98463.1 DUF2065 domain-containing protein [Ruegeria pomeroyi]NVL03384.1 DUF2065 domain-containing protein [Ruegeria pomeroyi]QWV08202.1 DUF2065 domain-containing protein [Ruegeria pomeroyi]
MSGLLLLGLGLVLIVEGAVYALAPGIVERLLDILRSLPLAARRQTGLLSMVIGLILVWAAYQIGF